jgi:hypothetical protein
LFPFLLRSLNNRTVYAVYMSCLLYELCREERGCHICYQETPSRLIRRGGAGVWYGQAVLQCRGVCDSAGVYVTVNGCVSVWCKKSGLWEAERRGLCCEKIAVCILRYYLCVLCMCVDMVGVSVCVEHVLSMLAKRP